MILPLWTILCFRKVAMHPFTNIQLGRTPLGLFSTFRKFQYWLCSSCKLWERHIWALLWWDRNNWSSPLIISIIRYFFFLSSHIFAKHFHYLLSLSLSETTTVCLSFFIMSTQAMPRILNWKTPLPSFKKISGERAGMSFRAGSKFKISWQSFIACLLLSRSPLLLKLLTLTEGRAYPSTSNAHRKTLIENDHFCAFWISCQRYREEEKKREIKCWSVLSSVTPNKCMSQIYQIKCLFLWFCLETVINSLYSISFPFSLLLFPNKRNLYFLTAGRILRKIIKRSACKHLEENIDMNSSLPGFVKKKSCHNNIVFIHHQIVSSVCWGKAVCTYHRAWVL